MLNNKCLENLRRTIYENQNNQSFKRRINKSLIRITTTLVIGVTIMSYDYLKIGKELSDETLDALIQEAISDGKLKRCDKCKAWLYEDEVKDYWRDDEFYYLCQHCE